MLAKNDNPDEYIYNGYGIGMTCIQNFHCLTLVWVKMSLLLELIWAHLCILIKREKLTQVFDDITLTAKTQYSNKYSNIQYSNATKMYKFNHSSVF